MFTFVAENLLSLSSQFLPTCTGRMVLPESKRQEKIEQIIKTLVHYGAVLVPYPCFSLITFELYYVDRFSILDMDNSITLLCRMTSAIAQHIAQQC